MSKVGPRPNPLTYCALFNEPARCCDINKCIQYLKVFTFWRKRILGQSFNSSSNDNLLLHIIFLATKVFMSNICLYKKKSTNKKQIKLHLHFHFFQLNYRNITGIL